MMGGTAGGRPASGPLGTPRITSSTATSAVTHRVISELRIAPRAAAKTAKSAKLEKTDDLANAKSEIAPPVALALLSQCLTPPR